jgi:hypothetical protein
VLIRKTCLEASHRQRKFEDTQDPWPLLEAHDSAQPSHEDPQDLGGSMRMKGRRTRKDSKKILHGQGGRRRGF